jgi:glycosyltransferase involved in cell wall biosynthesis
MKILVLCVAPVPRVLKVVIDLRDQHPDAEICIAAPEVSQWRLRGNSWRVWTIGEHSLPLDSSATRSAISELAPDLIVVPLGTPRQSLLSVARYVRAVGKSCFQLAAGPLRRVTSWRGIWLLLVLYSLLLWGPISVALRVSRLLDTVTLLASLVLARCLPRRQQQDSSGAVCHIIYSLGTGGAQRQLVEYLRHCARRDSPLRLLVLFDYNELFIDRVRRYTDAVEVLHHSCSRSLVLLACARAFPYMTAFLLIVRRLRQLRPQSVMSWLFLTNVIAAPAARLAGVPMVSSSIRNVSAWKTWPQYRAWWFRLADRLAAPVNDVIVANAQAVADDYAAWSGVDPGKIRVIRNGVDVDRLANAPFTDLRNRFASPETPMILTIGRLAVEKNHSMLLRCCTSLKQLGHQLSLVIVGHGELEQELQEQCLTMGLQESVHFVGKTDEPESFFRAADLFVLCSRIEGMPNVVMEAQALGLPVVTTDCGGTGEVVADQKTGLVVGCDDDAAMIAAIERLLTDPALRDEMGHRAVERMRSELSLERMARELDELTGITRR